MSNKLLLDDKPSLIEGDVARVKVGSESGHCCFEYSVVSTENPTYRFCETFDLEAANRIATALNNEKKI